MEAVAASVIIPTLRPGAALTRLIAALRGQTPPPAEILVIDSSSADGSAEQARSLGCHVEVIPRSAFDHGGTRNRAAALARHRYLAFMTQDALPADPDFLAHLLRPLHAGGAAAFARQVPYPAATPIEAFHRSFNYPPTGHIHQAADLARLGIRAAFFSNVASAFDRLPFQAAHGFPEGVILNEDMMLAYRLLRTGHRVAYAADARVYHSHDYHLRQQFCRYFDIGASLTQAGGLLQQLPSGREGGRYARRQLGTLVRQRAWGWLAPALMELAVKWLAFQLGHRASRLPRR
ncbi:MAG: glycosyltransferase family 2 protein, partial [Terriglobales bacterium]